MDSAKTKSAVDATRTTATENNGDSENLEATNKERREKTDVGTEETSCESEDNDEKDQEAHAQACCKQTVGAEANSVCAADNGNSAENESLTDAINNRNDYQDGNGQERCGAENGCVADVHDDKSKHSGDANAKERYKEPNGTEKNCCEGEANHDSGNDSEETHAKKRSKTTEVTEKDSGDLEYNRGHHNSGDTALDSTDENCKTSKDKMRNEKKGGPNVQHKECTQNSKVGTDKGSSYSRNDTVDNSDNGCNEDDGLEHESQTDSSGVNSSDVDSSEDSTDNDSNKKSSEGTDDSEEDEYKTSDSENIYSSDVATNVNAGTAGGTEKLRIKLGKRSHEETTFEIRKAVQIERKRREKELADKQKQGITTTVADFCFYRLTNGVRFTIEQIADNLDGVFIEPNSQTIVDLVEAGFWKKLKARGYTTEMIRLMPKSDYRYLTPDRNQVEVAERLKIYKTSSGSCEDVYHIGKNLEKYHLRDNPTLIADLIKHAYGTELVRMKVLSDTLYEVENKTYNVSDIGENLDLIDFPHDDKELINSLIKIGYRSKLIDLGYIEADYAATTSDSDSDFDLSKRPEYNLKKAKPRSKETRAAGPPRKKPLKTKTHESRTSSRPTTAKKAPKDFPELRNNLNCAYKETYSSKEANARASAKTTTKRPRKKKNFIAKGGVRKPKR